MGSLPRDGVLAVILAITGLGLLLSPLGTLAGTPLPLEITVLSSRTLSGTAGDYVKVEGQVRNAGVAPIDSITMYLSLVDTENNMPVDLEDWSAERGLYVGTIEPGQVFPLAWSLRFVKAGAYALAIVAIAPASETPCVSSITRFTVAPKRNINPGDILPVALGTPVVIALILSLVVYMRQREVY